MFSNYKRAPEKTKIVQRVRRNYKWCIRETCVDDRHRFSVPFDDGLVVRPRYPTPLTMLAST